MTELILILYSWQFYEQNKTTLDIYFLLKIFFFIISPFQYEQPNNVFCEPG